LLAFWQKIPRIGVTVSFCPEEECDGDKETKKLKRETNMTRIISITALLAVSLVAVNETSANGPHNSPKTIHTVNRSFRTYDSHHRNWSSYCWNREYNCYFYYCPTQACNYHWYAPARCYYPVSYLRVYRPSVCVYQAPAPGVTPLPVQVNVPVTITNVNRNNLTNGSSLPVSPVVPGGSDIPPPPPTMTSNVP
jgi:hypothetical protein